MTKAQLWELMSKKVISGKALLFASDIEVAKSMEMRLLMSYLKALKKGDFKKLVYKRQEEHERKIKNNKFFPDILSGLLQADNEVIERIFDWR
jgi:hypothetical protein